MDILLTKKDQKSDQRPLYFIFGKNGLSLLPSICKHCSNENENHILWMSHCEKTFLSLKSNKEKQSNHPKKRAKMAENEENLVDISQFIRSNKVHHCTYQNTQTILGRSFSIGIFQSFSYLSANTLAIILETIQGGGFGVFLIENASNLNEFLSMPMEFHKRYRTVSHPNITPFFNSRFLSSLAAVHQHFLLFSDKGESILRKDLAMNYFHSDSLNSQEDSIKKGKILKLKKLLKGDDTSSLHDNFPFLKNHIILRILNHCKTWDQALHLTQLMSIVNKTCLPVENTKKSSNLSSEETTTNSLLPISTQLSFRMQFNHHRQPFVVALTAGRGRGKSALLGLTIAAVLLSNRQFGTLHHIVVTAPCLQNVTTLMHFLVEGLKISKLKENTDFAISKTDGFVTRVTVFKSQDAVVDSKNNTSVDQTVEFLSPWQLQSTCRSLDSCAALSSIDLLCIDEAAAIPLEIVKDFIFPTFNKSMKKIDERNPLAQQGVSRVIMSSTIHGYEGTGRSLTLKLLDQLRLVSDVGVSLNDLESQSANDLLDCLNKSLCNSHENDDNLLNDGILLSKGRILHEFEMTEAIRYSSNDCTEKWLYHLLCLDASSSSSSSLNKKNRKQRKLQRKQFYLENPLEKQKDDTKLPSPQQCQLYAINRQYLFSGRPEAEFLLQQIMSLFVTSHYKNSPNDLQLLCDAPAHFLFCLFSPSKSAEDIVESYSNFVEHDGDNDNVNCMETTSAHRSLFNEPPKLLCAIQLCMEGGIPVKIVKEKICQSVKPSGDLIPWALVNHYFDQNLASLSGARVVRIATHPDYQNMGYGSRALDLLINYFSKSSENGKSDQIFCQDLPVPTVKKDLKPPHKSDLLPLLTCCHEGTSPKLDFIGVSFGSTPQLYRFWAKADFAPVVLNQTKNLLTNELNCIMIRQLHSPSSENLSKQWLVECNAEFTQRFCRLLCGPMQFYHPKDALKIVKSCFFAKSESKTLTLEEAKVLFSEFDLARLQAYVDGRADIRAVRDQFVDLAILYFTNRLPKEDIYFYEDEEILLLSMGLQGRTLNDTQTLVKVPSSTCHHVVQKLLTFLCPLFQKDTKTSVN